MDRRCPKCGVKHHNGTRLGFTNRRFSCLTKAEKETYRKYGLVSFYEGIDKRV